MFLYDPSQFIEWLGFPSQGEFFRGVFTSPSINKDKLYPPCAKTLNKYFLSSGDERHSIQSEKFIKRLKDISVARGVSADFFDTPSKPILISQFAIRNSPFVINGQAYSKAFKLQVVTRKRVRKQNIYYVSCKIYWIA